MSELQVHRRAIRAHATRCSQLAAVERAPSHLRERLRREVEYAWQCKNTPPSPHEQEQDALRRLYGA